ncbi:response regulator transcription factor [Marasmitruncus massiliensis]|uniref:response regulator transcription factor n=1 Tax=Marasmitruncus massiliensis TaxID=1944642 RepID=UPI000C7C2FE5|nr:response regulator transcription factor [Marasmitruncus massiliensis]
MLVILIVDGEYKVRKAEELYLRKQGFKILTASGCEEALSALRSRNADLIVLNIVYQTVGITLLCSIREYSKTVPVIVVADEASFAYKKKMFQLDVDDYITNPVDLEELVLRIHALLRRRYVYPPKQLSIGRTILDFSKLEIQSPELITTLPPKEFRLLFMLLSYPGRIFTRQEILEFIWGQDDVLNLHTVDVYINRLRKRLKRLQEFEIITVRYIGYKVHTKL